MSVPASSSGNGTRSFSPTVPVQRAVNNAGTSHGAATIIADSTWTASSPYIVPSKAMYHSLMIPGWGQINNGKKKKAALFFAAELICIGGYLIESHNVRHGDYTEWERNCHRTDRNTFIIYWMVSKVLGIVDAFVDAHLATFNINDITPEELRDE